MFIKDVNTKIKDERGQRKMTIFFVNITYAKQMKIILKMYYKNPLPRSRDYFCSLNLLLSLQVVLI